MPAEARIQLEEKPNSYSLAISVIKNSWIPAAGDKVAQMTSQMRDTKGKTRPT